MSREAYFSDVAKRLEEIQIVSQINKPDPAHDLVQLYVFLLADKQERGFIMQMDFLDDTAKAAGLVDDDDTLSVLQFFTAFPFVVEPQAVEETGMLLLKLNRAIPVGAFGLSEEDRSLYFRYCLESTRPEVPDPALVAETVTMMAYFVSLTASAIEAVAKHGKKRGEVIAALAASGDLAFSPLPPLPNAR